MGARPRGPEPSGPRGPGPREKTCCWSASSWLHLLRSWSLRSTRGGSVAVIHFIAHGGDEGVCLALAAGAQCPQPLHEGLGGGASFRRGHDLLSRNRPHLC